ncbi:MAG TPA: hypothetical protein GX500_05035 [Firmicutes bacterium]|nr:hypothetical protein [Candidatus Fermentithermobacillaceae bacterium]
MSKLPMVFSGIAVVVGVLKLVKFKESRIFSLLFYLSLCLSGVSRAVLYMAQGREVKYVDIGLAIVFGTASIGEILLIRNERREKELGEDGFET